MAEKIGGEQQRDRALLPAADHQTVEEEHGGAPRATSLRRARPNLPLQIVYWLQDQHDCHRAVGIVLL